MVISKGKQGSLPFIHQIRYLVLCRLLNKWNWIYWLLMQDQVQFFNCDGLGLVLAYMVLVLLSFVWSWSCVIGLGIDLA